MDYNFFADHKKPKKKTNLPRLLLLVLCVAGGGMLAINLGSTVLNYRQLTEVHEHFSAELAAPAFKNALEQVDAVEAEIHVLNGIFRNFQVVGESADLSHTATTELISQVTGSIPLQLNLDEYSITETGVSVTGTAVGLLSIAQLEYNLRATGRFENVTVSQMSQTQGEDDGALNEEEPLYSFEVTMGFPSPEIPDEESADAGEGQEQSEENANAEEMTSEDE